MIRWLKKVLTGENPETSHSDHTGIFSRLGDIPGFGYEGHPDVDRRGLPRQNDSPIIRTYSSEGGPVTSVWWDLPNGGGTSQSPASARASFDDRGATPSQVLRGLYESLELPGSASDYHFALMNA
jgi:hypothetical protein